MKSRIVYIFALIILVFCCFVCSISYATETGVVYIDSDKESLEIDDEVEVSINLKDSKTTTFNFSLYFDNTKFEFISEAENVNVEENRIIYVWYDINGGKTPKDKEIAKFRFKAKEEGIANFSIEGEFYSETGQLIQADFKEKQVEVIERKGISEEQKGEKGTNSQSDNAFLQVLRLDREGIVPTFNKDIYQYYLTVPSSINEIEVLAISENPNAKIEVTGNTNLENEINTINITVTSENQSQKKVYNIQVTRTDNFEMANTNLEILAIENYLLNPPFNTNQTNYNIEISNTIENVRILAVPENENAKVDIVGNDDLKVGNNLITVTVTSANGISKKSYLIRVYKRNSDEESVFIEEQKAQIEKAEELYKTEESSFNVNEDNYEKEVNKHKNRVIILGSISVIFVIIIFGIFIKNRKKSKK